MASPYGYGLKNQCLALTANANQRYNMHNIAAMIRVPEVCHIAGGAQPAASYIFELTADQSASSHVTENSTYY